MLLGDTHRLFSSLEALLTWRKGGRPVNLGKKRRIAEWVGGREGGILRGKKNGLLKKRVARIR